MERLRGQAGREGGGGGGGEGEGPSDKIDGLVAIKKKISRWRLSY